MSLFQDENSIQHMLGSFQTQQFALYPHLNWPHGKHVPREPARTKRYQSVKERTFCSLYPFCFVFLTHHRCFVVFCVALVSCGRVIRCDSKGSFVVPRNWARKTSCSLFNALAVSHHHATSQTSRDITNIFMACKISALSLSRVCI